MAGHATHSIVNMKLKYSLIEPLADAEIGERAIFDWSQKKCRVINAHVYFFQKPESDIIQAAPLFLLSDDLRKELENNCITGMEFIPCEISKSLQYDELSGPGDMPIFHCVEPCGVDGCDDVVFHSECYIKVSGKFIEIAKRFSLQGCEISDIE